MSCEREQVGLVLESKGKLGFAKRPIPTIKDPHYVKVQIKATGICGSDVHFYQKGAMGDFVVKKPMVLGHESCGVVVEIGDAVTKVKVGDKVAIEPGVPSRYSPETMSGRYNLCPHVEFAATPPVDGTLVKYYLSPEDFLYKLPEHISFAEGAAVEPLAVGVHANKLAGTKFGSKVLVFGAGPIGIVSGAVAKAFGATEVVFVSRSEFKLELTKKFGATAVLPNKDFPTDDNNEKLVQAIIGKFNGNKPDVILECSGAEACIQAGILACNPGGAFVEVAMGNDTINFPLAQFTVKEMKFIGSFRYYYGDYKDAVELISTGKIDIKPLITNRFPFDDAIKAFELNAEKRSDVTKTIIEGPTY